MPQFVDTETAREFMKETLAKISPEDINHICEDLETKSQKFRQKLSQQNIGLLKEEELYSILRSIFSVRRKAKKLLADYQTNHLKIWITDLLYGDAVVQIRLENFCNRLEGMENVFRHDLASELLHFTEPQKYWLWSRWIWDAKNQTGSLPLVITKDYDLKANGNGETYLKVGKAMAFIRHVGEAAEFEAYGNGEFGVDVYLCCVYVVYVYTVLRMRMTQEFNKVVPGLSEFTRRLLGIHKLEEN